MPELKKIELLAPARNAESARAAIDYGADAVYMGASKFGARYAAANTLPDVAATVQYARQYGVRVYATLNTILFEDELAEAEQTARQLISTGVDALIVQDMAYMEMGLEGVEFHASTQTFNADPDKVNFLARSGFSRVILERGLTARQIQDISRDTAAELEVFVHGAICVGHSGQCYLSRSMGPRSGNRGECSQPCRLPYDLVDHRGLVLIRGKHLLSVRDLDLSQRIGELIDVGITSFKIEGRLKDISYVKNTVNYYRRRIDAEIAARKGFSRASSGITTTAITPDLSKSFTRGRSEYFWSGKRPGVASFDTPKALGEEIGKVIRAGKGFCELDGTSALAPQDGICFIGNGELQGTGVNGVEGRTIFLNKELTIPTGTTIYRNYDHVFNRQLNADHTRRTIGVTVSVETTAESVEMIFTDQDGNSAKVYRQGDFEPSKNPHAMEQTLRTQVAKSGDTIFSIVHIAIHSQETDIYFIPASLVNQMRREGLELLREKRLAAHRQPVCKPADKHLPYPAPSLDGRANVTNSLAKRFYLAHGVEYIAPGLDTKTQYRGECVMQTPYCIRRETGQCLLQGSQTKGPLYLVHGPHRYRLEFDCRKCMMNVICE